MDELLSAEHPAPVALVVKARRKRRRKKQAAPYTTMAIRNFYDNGFTVFRVREKFAQEMVEWLNCTRGHCAFLAAYTPEPFYPLLPKPLVQSFLTHRIL